MRASLFPLLAACACVPALAQDQQQAAASYKQMCVQAAAMPKPYGEYDLKGNARLDEYCGCFGAAFAAQAINADPKAKPPTPDQAAQRELAMRNRCRQKMGLPAAK
ncbi:hypothetical protein GCM10027321_24150 [Massilia terrae]|uniref:Uncharacterized protein n=1 Tax=Massilia terrae TaxID=1811224 RepID=A0ABT2CXL4_9BURK|nr:hypothetical protein [Massilia terrae]MCS0658724.1 hypothetical protein [Massilia terrae]